MSEVAISTKVGFRLNTSQIYRAEPTSPPPSRPAGGPSFGRAKAITPPESILPGFVRQGFSRLRPAYAEWRSLFFDEDEHSRVSTQIVGGFKFESAVNSLKSKTPKGKGAFPAGIGYLPKSDLAMQFVFHGGAYHIEGR